MNILPFTLVMMAFFALLSTSLMTQSKHAELTAKAYSSYMQAQRMLRKTLVSKSYEKIRTQKESSSKETSPRVCQNWRQQPSKASLGRLNIYMLLFADPHPHLQETFIHLMDELYVNLPIYQALKASNELPAFFSHWKEHTDLTKIAYKNPNYQELLYKMLKGCIRYDLNANNGYPPITDFIIIDETNSHKPMPWRLAKPVLLRAFFGSAITEKILTLESQKQVDQPGNQSTLSTDELQHLFDHEFMDPSILELLNSNTGKSSSTNSIGTDSTQLTQVQVRL